MTLPKDFLSNPFVYAERAPIGELQKIIEILSETYELTGKTFVDDKVYDQLLVILEERDPTNKLLGKVGAKTKKGVKLPYYAGSLDKIKPDSDAIATWKRTFRGPYLVSDKLDGISCILEAKPFGFKLYTRGDGQYGSDITQLESYIGLPHVKLDEGVVIRGELIISKANFEKIKGVMANARNAVAGTANAKKINRDVASLIEFIAYNIQTGITGAQLTSVQQFEALQALGFKVPVHVVFTSVSNELLSDYLVERRRDSRYDIDGLVVSDSSKVYEIEEGKNPDYAFAFKNVLTNETAEVQVREVLWRVAKSGYIKPTVRISPVVLSGVTITFATAFNAKFICDNVIGPGSILEIVRSGDVIPHILKVVEPSATGKPQLPSLNYVWTPTEVDIVFVDAAGRGKGCPNAGAVEGDGDGAGDDDGAGAIDQEQAALQMKTQKIVYFFTALGIKGIAEKTVQKFIENGIDTPVKILTVDSRRLVSIEGIGKALVDKIRENAFKQLDSADLPTLMDSCSCFGRGIGKKKLTAVLDVIPNLLDLKSGRSEMIAKIKDIQGFDTKTATLVADGIVNFKEFYAALAGAGISMSGAAKRAPKEKQTDKLRGETVVFTGIRDKNLERFIQQNCGKIGSAVTGSTTMLIHADNAKMTVKLTKAVEKGVRLYSISEFKRRYLSDAKDETVADEASEDEASSQNDDIPFESDERCSRFIDDMMM